MPHGENHFKFRDRKNWLTLATEAWERLQVYFNLCYSESGWVKYGYVNKSKVVIALCSILLGGSKSNFDAVYHIFAWPIKYFSSNWEQRKAFDYVLVTYEGNEFPILFRTKHDRLFSIWNLAMYLTIIRKSAKQCFYFLFLTM